jgi:glycosyltransferase involved in cell wall biosynthesis
MNDARRLTFVIPAFNEEQTIGSIVEEIREGWPEDEILVVDDGSTDGTAEVSRRAGATVLSHPCNLGNGAAVKNGIRHATGEIVLLMDGDGQHSTADIPRLLAATDPYDMVVGVRTRQSKVSAFRTFGNVVLARVASVLSGMHIPDLTSGFRAARRNVLMEFLPLLPNRFSYPATVTLALLQAGYAVQFVRLDTIRRRKAGVSKLRPFIDGPLAVLNILKVVALFSPIRIFLPAAGALVATGLAWGAWSLADGTSPAGPVMTLVAGILVFLQGLLAERSAWMLRHPGVPGSRKAQEDA